MSIPLVEALELPITVERTTQKPHAEYANTPSADTHASVGSEYVHIHLGVYRCLILDSDLKFSRFQQAKNRASVTLSKIMSHRLPPALALDRASAERLRSVHAKLRRIILLYKYLCEKMDIKSYGHAFAEGHNINEYGRTVRASAASRVDDTHVLIRLHCGRTSRASLLLDNGISVIRQHAEGMSLRFYRVLIRRGWLLGLGRVGRGRMWIWSCSGSLRGGR